MVRRTTRKNGLGGRCMAQQVKIKFVYIPPLNKYENYVTAFILALCLICETTGY
jgi:hypothetical protein